MFIPVQALVHSACLFANFWSLMFVFAVRDDGTTRSTHKKTKEDTFGQNDEDWMVYRAIVSSHQLRIVEKRLRVPSVGVSPDVALFSDLIGSYSWQFGID